MPSALHWIVVITMQECPAIANNEFLLLFVILLSIL